MRGHVSVRAQRIERSCQCPGTPKWEVMSVSGHNEMRGHVSVRAQRNERSCQCPGTTKWEVMSVSRHNEMRGHVSVRAQRNERSCQCPGPAKFKLYWMICGHSIVTEILMHRKFRSILPIWWHFIQLHNWLFFTVFTHKSLRLNFRKRPKDIFIKNPTISYSSLVMPYNSTKLCLIILPLAPMECKMAVFGWWVECCAAKTKYYWKNSKR